MKTDSEINQSLLAAMDEFRSGESGLDQISSLLTEGEAERRARLEKVGSGNSPLELIERFLQEANALRITRLTNFAVDNTALGELLSVKDVRRSEFDLFEILNIYWREEVHSRVLAWLLDPRRNHRLGDHFLKAFLADTGCVEEQVLHNQDWSEATVVREWSAVVDDARGYLDILVVNWRDHILCAIENKVFSGEGIGEDGVSQLTHYRRALELQFPEFDRKHIFLSPHGHSARDQEEQRFWQPANYGTVHRLVEHAAIACGDAVTDEVRVFLQQYATTIRRNIMPESGELERLARKIYLENREVIDLLKQNGPDWVAEAKQMLKEAVAEQKLWKLDSEDREFVRFRPAQWDDYPSTRTGTGWGGSESLLLFQFRFYDETPWLDLALSAGSDESVRESLFDSVRQHPEVFRLRESSMKGGWMVLHQERDYMLDDADYSAAWDDGTVRNKIRDWVSAFAEGKFQKMNEVIVNCLAEYEEKRSQRRPSLLVPKRCLDEALSTRDHSVRQGYTLPSTQTEAQTISQRGPLVRVKIARFALGGQSQQMQQHSILLGPRATPR